MARTLSVDTSFLIDLERERRDGCDGPAHRLLQREADAEICLSAAALGELAEAYGDPGHPALWAIRKSHRVLPLDENVALAYAALAREHRGGGAMGSNDLWIAAASLHHHLPLLTADVERFARVRGLELVAYK